MPPMVASGIGPLLVEYIDMISMAGITANAGIDLGIPAEVRGAPPWPTWSSSWRATTRTDSSRTPRQLATQLAELGALDVYVLPDQAGRRAHRRPRAGLLGGQGGRGRRHRRRGRPPGHRSPSTWPSVGELAAATGVAGGGVRPRRATATSTSSVFQPDPEVRRQPGPRHPGRRCRPGGCRLRRARHRHRQAGRLHRPGGPGQARPHAPDQGGLRPGR